jgi:lipopolysaccharide assembly outer membrane protein LptD (OstA)
MSSRILVRRLPGVGSLALLATVGALPAAYAQSVSSHSHRSAAAVRPTASAATPLNSRSRTPATRIAPIVLAVPVAPASTPAARVPVPAAPPRTESVEQEVALTAAHTSTEATLLTASGSVLLTTRETRLSAEAATWDRAERRATLSGRLRFDEAGNTVFGSRGDADYREQKARFSGDVRLVLRSAPEDAAATAAAEEYGTLTCDRLTYDWRTRQATAEGNVTLRTRDRAVVADRAAYDGRTGRVTLSGRAVRLLSTSGDALTATKMTLTLRAGGDKVSLDEGGLVNATAGWVLVGTRRRR